MAFIASSQTAVMNSRRWSSSWHRVKTASNWSTITYRVCAVSRAPRSAAGVAVGTNTVTGPVSRGISPAASSDDLPEPDGPTTISGSPTPAPMPQPVASSTSRCVTSSRPKNHGASCGPKLASPR